MLATPPIPLTSQPYHYDYSFTSPVNLSPAASVYNFSEPSSPDDSQPPSPLYENPALPPASPTKPATRLRSGNRVPRPRNAFMIFRSEFWAEAKISKNVEHDHRHISRIIGHCWNQLTDDEKDVWRRRAEQEKIEHGIKYPGYRFTPSVRTKQVVRRNVKRNGEDEMLRCKQVADLLLAGKVGKDLDNAVKTIDKTLGRGSASPSEKKKAVRAASKERAGPGSGSAFRSPLLPPIELSASAQPQSLQYSTDLNLHGYQEPAVACEQDWAVQYPSSATDSQQAMVYPIQHFTSPQPIALPSSSQGYNSGIFYPSDGHTTSHSDHAFPRSSGFNIDFTGHYYHGTQGHAALVSANLNGWMPSN
ncbi:hypothetical protein H0H92_007432 [Tricholoma furcatifolium]|nr:hypothetical protein H0H92_007432 [Tricholoma furcatifolium]